MSAPSSTAYVQQDEAIHSVATNPNRRSKLFFDVCDMRTATVVLNILNMIFTLAVGLILMTMYTFETGPYKGHAIFSAFFNALYVAGLSALGLYGAMKWKLNVLMGTSLGFGALFLYRICRFDWIDAILAGVLLYAHVSLTKDMRDGLMTPETFAEEEYVHESGRDFVEMAHAYISPVEAMV